MNAAEWFEAYTSASSNGLTSQAILLTLVSSYMVMAHVSGKSLTTVQVCLANFVYITGSGLVLLANYSAVMDAATAREQAVLLTSELANIGVGDFASSWALICASVNALFVVISFLFMWQVRHPKSQ